MEPRGFLLHKTLESVSSALTSSRIRLTCSEVSRQYILLGANTGSVYVFDRESAKFIQLLSVDAIRDPVALLRFSPDEKYLAVVTNKNKAIYVMEFALRIRRSEKELLKISAHKADIGHVLWIGSGADLSIFSADESGSVFKTAIGSRKGLFSSGPESDLIYQCDTRVVQMTYDEDLQQLLLSSMTKSVMIDFRRTQAFQVGTKPRDGPFGASHFKGFEAPTKDILLARPGKRIWCADIETARVKQTINYQPSFESTAQTRLFGPEGVTSAENVANVNFSRLIPFVEVVLSVSDKIIVVIDADSNKILQWHADGGQIIDISVHEATQSIYALVTPTGDTQKLAHVTFNMKEFVSALIMERQFTRAIACVHKYGVSDIQFLEALLPQISDETHKESMRMHIAHLYAQQKEREAAAQKAADEAAALLQERELPKSESPPIPVIDLGASILDLNMRTAKMELSDSTSQAPPPSEAITVPSASSESSSVSSTPLSRSPNISASRDDLMAEPAVSASSSPSSTVETPLALSDSQLESPTLSGSFLKAEEAPAASALPVLAPTAKRATGGAKKKKPRLATIAPPTVENRAPSPIMLELQQRASPPVSAPPPAHSAPAPASTAAPSSDSQSSKGAASTEEGPVSINAARLPLVIQSALSNPLSKDSPAPTSEPSPSSSPSTQAPIVSVQSNQGILHASSAPLSTSPSSAVAATADKAIGEIKSMARKIIDLPSMFSRSASAPVLADAAPLSTSQLDASDDLTTNAITKLHEFKAKLQNDSSNRSRDAPSFWEKRLLFDSIARPALQRWIDSYSAALVENSSGGKFPLGTEFSLREIVTACFEFQVEVSSLPASKLRLWTERESAHFITSYVRYLSLSEALAIANEKEWSQCVQALLDYDQKCFLQREKHIFNPRFRTWEQLEELLDSPNLDSATQTTITKLVTKSMTDFSLVMHFLPRMFVLLPSQAVQIAVASFPMIRPHNVESAIPPEKSSLLVDYFSRMMKKYAQVRSSRKNVLRYIQVLLADRPAESDLFDAHQPRRGSLSVQWPNNSALQQILNPQSSEEEYDLPSPESLIAQFQPVGYWSGLLHALRKSNRFSQALKLIVQLDDVVSFSSLLLSPASSVPSLFNEALQQLLTRNQDETYAITILHLFETAVSALGADQTMRLIASQTEPELRTRLLAHLQPHLFQNLISQAEKSTSQRKIAKDILETVDSYLWSMRSPTLSSQFRALEQAEAQENRLHDNNLADIPYISATSSFDGRIEHSIQITHRTPLVRSFGSLTSHWGVRTSLRAQCCPRCELQLHETITVGATSSSRVVVFEPCGHTFHEACADEDYCPTCARQKLSKV